MFQTNVNGAMAGGGSGTGNGGTPYSTNNGQATNQQGMNGNGNGSGAGSGGGANNGSANNGGGSMSQLIYPALHLQPLNDTFAPKQICLAPPGPQNKIKIGRQTNNKTIPQPNNGYFDSKVLSRMHAEVWSQDGKVYIKDVKSSNGTFINGARLSPEGQESDTFELHTDDVVEFGIDIVGEDNKSIIHHKVACRVFLVMTAEEALGLRHDFAALYRGGIAGSTLNHHVVGPGAEGGLRRSKMGGPGGYGSVGGGPNGMMSFDHILHRLQAELQKSRETAGELGTLNVAMNDIGETLGGGLPPMQNPPYQHLIPSASSSSANDPALRAREEEQRQQQSSEASEHAAELKALEEQVKETQQALQTHIDRLSAFEARLEDNEAIKTDIMVMREQVRNARDEASEARYLLASRRSGVLPSKIEEDDFDDGASVLSVDTVVPQDADPSSIGKGPVGVDEVDSADTIGQLSRGDGDDAISDAHDPELLRRLKEHVGPLAPPDGTSQAIDRSVHRPQEATNRDEELSRRLEAMESQLERALELGRNLAGQHAEATETVRKLEERVKSLETDRLHLPVKGDEDTEGKPIKQEDGSNAEQLATMAIGGEAAAAGGILGMLESKWGKWRDAFEADFAKERAGLAADREDLRRVVRMWDTLNQVVEDLVEGAQTDDGGASTANGDEPHQDKAPATSVQASNHPSSNSSKKKKKRKGGGNNASSSSNHTVIAPMGPVRRQTNTVGLGASAELNRHLRALIYTDDYNLLVRETHLESEGSTSASSSVSDTSRSVTSKTTDDTSVGSGSGDRNAAGGGSSNGGDLDDLPDGVRKRAMAHLASGRRKGRRWPEFGGGNATNGNGFDNAASLPVLGAAGVVVVGMTAWIMAGKGMNLGSAGGG